MTRIVVALILFALGSYAASRTRDGYRDGAMPALISSRISPFVFDRVQVPQWFWAATAINLVIAAGLTVAGILILVVGVRA